MASKRREFLKLSAFLLPGLSVIRSRKLFKTHQSKPIIISTWDSGREVNIAGWSVLENGGSSLDAVEKAANFIEDQVSCCVGLGANPDRDGFVTLDACIMDDKFNCGSVMCIQDIKHPTSVARKVMELTPHVVLTGEGAKKFALECGFNEEEKKLSKAAEEEYRKWLIKSEYKPEINIEKRQLENVKPPVKLEDGSFNHDTMGILALDSSGRLSGACTTSGMAFKMHGRVGDSPIIGAGLYVDNNVGAVTSSGQGEEVIRTCGSHTVVEMMRLGHSPEEACRLAVKRIIDINPDKAKTFQVGFIAVNKVGKFGAYSILPGFTYSVKADDIKDEVYNSKSWFS